MRRIRFRTIFSRMLFLQCVTIIGILLIVAATTVIVVRSEAVRHQRESLSDRLTLISRELSVSKPQAQELMQSSAVEHALMTQLYMDSQLLTFAEDAVWQDLIDIDSVTTDFDYALKHASGYAAFTDSYFQGRGLSVLTGYLRVNDGQSEGILLIHCDMSSINADSVQLMVWILIIALIAIIVAVFCSYYIATSVINPFVEMNHTVQCYSKGDLSRRIRVEGRDEAAQLGRSFNEMAEQLRSLEDTRRSFVANVSHELRSPLTGMKGFLEAMFDGTIAKEDQEHYIGLVLSETRRMTLMVNDLLDLARIESGTIILNYETFDINELIRRVLITFEARIVAKQLELDVRFAQEQCYVWADSTQISQVIRNLIDNAIKYSPEGKLLVISTYPLRKEVYVSIKDNGVGIPLEDIPHVFDRFYKVEKAHTPSPQVGSGLGLSIVKRIIEQHGQTITVRSARNRGTQFTFSLQKASLLKRTTDGGRRNGQ